MEWKQKFMELSYRNLMQNMRHKWKKRKLKSSWKLTEFPMILKPLKSTKIEKIFTDSKQTFAEI